MAPLFLCADYMRRLPVARDNGSRWLGEGAWHQVTQGCALPAVKA